MAGAFSTGAVQRKTLWIFSTVLLFAVLLFAIPAFAADAPSRIAPACGSKNGGADVILDGSRHTVAPARAGMARLYFIQDLGPRNFIGETLVGLDGTWVGANKDNSYLSLSVPPGEHHICVQVKSHFSSYGRLVELSSFTAQPGETIFFRTRLVMGENNAYLFLDPANADEAKHLISTYPMSISHVRN